MTEFRGFWGKSYSVNLPLSVSLNEALFLNVLVLSLPMLSFAYFDHSFFPAPIWYSVKSKALQEGLSPAPTARFPRYFSRKDRKDAKGRKKVLYVICAC